MNRILRSQLPKNPRDLAVFNTTTGSSPGRTRGSSLFSRGLAILAFMFVSFFSINSFGQAATYNFAASIETYSEITGGTVLFPAGTAYDDAVSATITIPSFTYNGTAFTTMRVNTNGWMSFGAATTGGGYTPLSGSITAATAVFAPFGADQGNTGGSAAEIRWQDTGTEIVVQWKSVNRWATIENLNYQVRLTYSGAGAGTIRYVYGTMTFGASTNPQVGHKTGSGAGNIGSTLFNLTLANIPAGNSCRWVNAVRARLNSSTMLLNSTTNANVSCDNGTTFTWTPQTGPNVNPITIYSAVSAIGSNGATIGWTAPTNATQYDVQYRTVGSCEWTTAATGVATTTYAITGLNPLTAYQVRVRPRSSTNQAAYSHIPPQAGGTNTDGYIAAGTFTTLAAQCSGTPAAITASFTGGSAICANGTKAMSAAGLGTDLGLTTQWQVSSTSGGPYTNVSGGTGANAASYTTAAIAAPGTYYYVCTSTCSNSSITTTSNELVLTVNALPTIAITAPNGGAFCGTQSLTASGASTYVWTPASSLSTNTGETVTFTGTAAITVNVSGTDANGCVGTAAQAVTYTAPSAITMSSTVPNFCGTGGTATISASASVPYTYVFESLDGATLSNATASSVDATVTGTSAIRATGTDAASGCAAQAVYSVGVYPLPSATVTTTASGVCPGTPATINSGLSAGNFTVSSIPHVAYVAPASAGVLMNNGVAVTPLGGGTMDDGGWGGIPIGFSFNFFGNNFTTLGAGTNGVLMFGTIPAFGTNDGELGDYTFTGPPYFPNAANAGNVIALLASDMQMANSVNGSIKYWTEGYAPNRKFVIRYDRVHGWSNNPEAIVTCVLYETLGMVDIHVTKKSFGNSAIIGLQNQDKTIGAVAPGRAGGTWTVTTPEGWRFSPPANYFTVWSATDVNGTYSVTTNVDGSTVNTFNGFSATVAPLLTTQYSISYANTLTGCDNLLSPAQVTMLVLGTVAPQGVAATSTVTTACPGANIPLATDYTGSTDGLTFQWQVSTDGGASWNPIAGATAATYTAAQTVASSYQVGITSCGGTVTYTTPVAVALTGFADCYCTSTATTTFDEEITNVTIGSLNNTSTCATVAPGAGSLASQYSNYTSGAGAPAPIALIQGSSVSGSLTVASCGTTNYTSGAAIFIDYNQNGLFTDAGEMVWNNGAASDINCVPATTLPVSFTVPLTATPGLTRMRVIDAESNPGATMNPCLSYGYGETEDYMVQILGPCDPATFTPPLASADDVDATVCGTQTSQLTAFDFNGSANPIYMWYDAATGGNLLQNSTSNFFTPAPITATTTWYVATNTGTCITDRFPVTLNWVAPESITLTNSNPSSCGTTSVATNIAATSSNAGYSYTWTASPAAGSGITAGTAGATLSGVTPTINGVYVYTATAVDASSGCTTTATTTVGFYSPLTGTASVTQPLVCGANGSVNFSVTGSGTVFASDFSSATLNPAQAELCNNAAILGGQLQLTAPVNTQKGGILITNTTGIASNDFQIDFDMITTAGTTPPADGFSYSYGPDVVCMPTPVGTVVDNTVVGVGAANPENGSGSGIRLSFDAYTNGVNVNGIYLMYNCPRINPSSTLTTADGLYYYANNTSWIGGASTHVTITINALGEMSMWLNGTQVLNNAALPAGYLSADKSSWKHAFVARTGGLNQGHYIDNLDIHYNNFYEYSVDNGTTWTTTSPISVPAPSSVHNLARYVLTPSCSVDLGTTTVDYVVVAPTGVTGGSTCLNGSTLNVSGFGLPIGGQTATYSFGSNLSSGVGTSNGNAGVAPSIQGNPITISLPAGATVTAAQLVLTNVTSDYMGEVQVALSGAATLGTTQVFTNFPASGATGTITLSPSSITNGTVNVLLGESYDDPGTDATAADISLNLTYSIPTDPSWFDNSVASAGSFVGTGASFNVVGTTILPSTASSTTATAYAANVVTNGASTCYSATVPATVTVGLPLTVSVGASAPVTQTFTLASNYSVEAGATQTLTGTIAIPAGVTVTSTVLQVTGVNSTAGTWGSDVDIAMSGASTVANQVVASVNAGLTNAGPFTYTASNIAAPGGNVFVTITHNYSFGGSMDFESIALLVTYSAPVTGSVCPGTPVTLNATTTGGGSNPTYQWNLNGAPIVGATSASYVATPASATDAYTATVVDDCNPSGVTSSGFSANLFTVTAGTITGPAAILVNDFTAPIPGAGTWNIAGQDAGSTIQWSYGTVSTGPFTTIAGGTNPEQTLYATGAGGTVFLTATTTTTDGCTIQANVVTVVLGNAIDSICDAAAIALGNQGGIEWSNAAAGAQPGETYGSGIANPGSTIWFSFVAPASGHVSIETTSSIFWDNYMTLFSGSDCTNPAGLTQIGFNDDANGTAQAALMNVTCLNPGTTYYIQVRGFGNSIGLGGITLTDLGNTAPAITGISSNITASAATGTCAATVTWTEPVATDDQGCVTMTSDIASGTSFNVGTTTVTYTATDAQGLVTTSSFTVTVNDTQLPTVTAPSAVTVTAALNACTATATLGSATTADNCGVATSTNNAPATFPIGNTTVTYTVTDVNGNVATATQVVTVEVNPANIWYVDADGDNYGVAGATVTACSQPVGYAANTTDCNDALAGVNPGAIEICGNSIDDNCNGTSEEGCLLPGENPSNATSMTPSIWPNCNAINGTLVNATASGSAQTVCLTGEDKWHQFVATSEGVSIVVNSSAADIVIELQTAAGVLVAQENAVSGIGGETLNHYGLTAGQVYKVGVRNYNSALGTGTYSICAKMLKRGGCDYGPGPYTLCQYFKATWAGATGTSYTFTFTGLTGPAAGNVYTRTQTSDICVLSSVLPTLPYGSTYNVLITNTYTINNAAGVAETVAVPGLAPCSVSTAAQPATALRTTDQCAAGPRFRGSIVAALPWVCGATNWRWEFTELDASGNPVGLPVTVNRGAASNFINLGTVLQLQYGKTYSVRSAPIMPYTGTNYQWGASVCMSIVGTAGMVAEGSQANQKALGLETANEVNMSLYPNPTHGTDVNINLSGVDSDNVQIRVVDAMGRQVWNNRYSVSGVLNTNITFERPLANGLYMVEAIFNGEVQTQRMMVQK